MKAKNRTRMLILVLAVLVVLQLMLIYVIFYPHGAHAGLDRAGRWDDVVAVYDFDDIMDDGPREHHGILHPGAKLSLNGKEDDGLQLRRNGSFIADKERSTLGIVNGQFSIVGWVKLGKQNSLLTLGFFAIRDDSVVGSIALVVLPDGTLAGLQFDVEDGRSHRIDAVEVDVSDEEWHHIAYTKYSGLFTLFLDGEVVARDYFDQYLGFVGTDTSVAIGGDQTNDFRGLVYIDEVGFFETGFSPYEISGLYENGLDDFMGTMPVDVSGLKSTMWSALKND